MHDDVKPSEKRGGTNAGEEEIREKGEWIRSAKEGIVPAELGGSDAPGENDEALGRTTGDDTPATEEGIDLGAGDQADAVTDGGPNDSGDLKDVGAKLKGV